MTTKNNNQLQQDATIPQAVAGKGGKGFSGIWLLPIAALIIGVWLVYRTVASAGFEITVRFNDAEGIVVKKTQIKYKDVSIGVVEDLRFSEDRSEVIVVAEIGPQYKDVLNGESRFWVVRPRIQGLSVSGIDTLLSGAYIAMDPGKGEEDESEFIGLEEPPSLLSDVRGTVYRLRAENLGSVTKGAPVYYRDIVVGEVISYQMVPDHSHVAMEIFIRMPHDLYVNKQSRFWNVSGADLKLDSEGLALNVQSLTSLLSGGIAFSTPSNASPAEIAEEGAEFVLYGTELESQQKVINITVPYQLYFEDSVRGLSIGAPVEFRGIRVGSVQDIFPGQADIDYRIQVMIGISPERVVRQGESQDNLETRTKDALDSLVKKGLRAQLKTGNLLTGQMYIDLDLHSNLPESEIVEANGYMVLPTIPGSLSGMTRSLTNILRKLEQVPIEEIGKDIQQITAGVNLVVNDKKGLRESIAQFNGTLAEARVFLATVNTHADPLLKNINDTTENIEKLLQQLRGIAKAADAVFKNVEALTDTDSTLIYNMNDTLNEFSDAARSIKSMAEYLERHPEALLQGKK